MASTDDGGQPPTPAGKPGRGYFAVGSDSFHKATELDLNAAGVFLVLARGTGPDDVTTSWSAQAASARLGIRWKGAKDALGRLKATKLVTTSRDSTKPKYTLAKKGEPVILPNTLVDGVRGALPPLLRVRQMQDVMTLRLLVDLYAATDLPAWGGVDPGVVQCVFDVERAGQRGSYIAWRVTVRHTEVSWTGVTMPHRLDEDDIPDGGNPGSAFFDRFHALTLDGLFDLVPTVCEGENGEALFPLTDGTDIQAEGDLYAAAFDAAQQIVPDWDAGDGLLVALPRRIAQPAVRGIYRPRYRTQTKPTSLWYADHVATCRAYTASLRHIATGNTAHSLRFGLTVAAPKDDAA